MPYSQDLENIQWAREAVAGTDLPCTSRMIVERFNPTPSSPEAYRPALARGLLLANRGGETVIRRGTDWNAEGPLTYEQAQHHFSGVIANVAAPTGAGPYVWEHVRDPAGFPDLASFTFERREDDGTTPVDHAWHYAMYDTLELTFDLNDVWKFKADGFARRVQDETMTAALTLPTHEVITTPGTKLYIDGAWATLGTTQILAQILKGSIKFGSGAAPLFTADGRADLDFGAVGYASSRVIVEANLTLLLGAQYATEKAAAEAQTLRAIRLQVDSGTKQLQIDALMKYRVPELFSFDFDEEQVIVTLDLVGATDGTNAFAAKVTNSVATFQ